MTSPPPSLTDLLIAELERRRDELEPVLIRADGRVFALVLEVSVKAAVRHVGLHLFVPPDLAEPDAA